MIADAVTTAQLIIGGAIAAVMILAAFSALLLVGIAGTVARAITRRERS